MSAVDVHHRPIHINTGGADLHTISAHFDANFGTGLDNDPIRLQIAFGIDYFSMVGGRQFPHPIAVEEKAAMSVLLLFFVLLCVRSFIAARRARA